MGTKYPGVTSSGYNSSAPADDGSQVASNLVTWAGVKTKLADPIKTLADAENTALVAALDLSARAISSPDTAIASDHWKTLQVTGTTTITLSSAASMGAGYEVGVFNAGTGVVAVTPGAASDTINGVSASVTVSIKGTKIFRTNQALTGYNVVGGYDPQTIQITGQFDNGGQQGITTGLVLGGLGSTYGRVLETANDTWVLGHSGTRTGAVTSDLQWKNGVVTFPSSSVIQQVTKRKTADESVTSSTVLQDDDHLTFAIAANEEWIATFQIDAGNALNLTGFQAAVTVPSGATLNVALSGNPAQTGGSYSQRTTTSGFGLNSVAGNFASSGSGVFVMTVWVLNGATPGSVTLQWAQGTSSGTALTFRKGSFLQATRVA